MCDPYIIRGLNILFPILTFAKPSCDNVLQHIITRGLGNVNKEKNVLLSFIYTCTYFSNTPGLSGNEALAVY